MAEKITNAEREVMELLWEKSPQTAQEVIDVVAPRHDWHKRTVKTLLHRLKNKKILGFKKEKRTFLYYPLISRKAYVQEENRKFLESWFGDKISHQLLVSFAATELLNKQEIEELKKLLEKTE